MYDLVNDPGQKRNISQEQPAVFERLRTAYGDWFKDVSKGWEWKSVIPCGYAEFPITHLHAVQSTLSGVLKFHGKGFHHDWIVNWSNPKDGISWDIDIVQSGRYRIAVKYVCPDHDVGAKIRVKVAGKELKASVDLAFDPELYPVFDRAPRAGVLEKPWATLEIGRADLAKGSTKLILSADSMPGSQVMEVREVILERLIDCSSA